MQSATDYIEKYFQIMKDIKVSLIQENDVGNEMDLGFDLGIEKTIGLIQTQTDKGNKLMFLGNGGSAGIASHSAVDYWRNGEMRALAFNDGALLTCISNDFGYGQVFEKPIRMFADTGDIVIAISSSGQSENILRGAYAGRELGCKIITLSGFAATNPLRKIGDINFYVPVSHYGYVEMGHQMIIHAILDLLAARKNDK